jgi:hypothetical protein
VEKIRITFSTKPFPAGAIREQKPLIHNITNYVVMNYTANALLAMGVSPVMAHAQNEVEDMVSYGFFCRRTGAEYRHPHR